MPFNPETDLALIPHDPGVYLMKGADGEIFYVGKAANLSKRLSQYFGNTSDTRYFVSLLDKLLHDVQVLITNNEAEALILEAELIKRHQPRFNVRLKDGKGFLHIRIDEREQWPRLSVVRRVQDDGARYFGPYYSASKLRETVKIIERNFQLRGCEDGTFHNRARPCLQYQIKRCSAPCVLPNLEESYRQEVRDVMMFLQGRKADLVEQLKAQMIKAAELMDFERAAVLRDRVRAIETSLQPQQVVVQQNIDRDVMGLYREGSLVEIALLFIRSGKLVGSKTFSFENQECPDEEMVSTFLNLYYNGGHEVPDEVLLPVPAEGQEALTARLTQVRGRKSVIKVPQRGPNKRLMEMAAKNAEQAFFQARRSEDVRHKGLERLQKRLKLSNFPRTMECYDISLFQGTAPVASRVVFESGLPKRSAYRHYKIRHVEGTDDYAMMREVLIRRLKRGLKESDLPDLIVVDGGKGQLNVALAVFKDLGIEGVDVVGLAKARVLDGPRDDNRGMERSDERVFKPNVKDPIILRPNTDEMFLMARLRDEAHRFAITFHRKLRMGRNFDSVLDAIPGVGPWRKKTLLKTFGSVKALKNAPIDEIADVPGIGWTLATEIHDALSHFRAGRR
ncbi:MAG: excinuclease ABC subunit UvrC [Bradymonadia bacterium]